jgi:hypothetical protein
MLVITCPLCRDQCSICEVTFALLMKQHRPEGTLLMDFIHSEAGFVLAIQRATSGRLTVAEPTFFFLETVQYHRHIASLPPDEWSINTLFSVLADMCRTRSTAASLLAETPGGASPIRLLTAEFALLASLGRDLLEEEGDAAAHTIQRA